MKKRKIAIVTYNRVGDGQYANGVMQKDGKEIYGEPAQERSPALARSELRLSKASP